MKYTINGSDIPIILGLSPFTKRDELAQIKAGIKKIEYSENIYTKYGEDMEPVIRTYINTFMKTNYVIDKLELENAICKLDGLDRDISSILEIKTTAKKSSNIQDYKIYLVQLLYYMMKYSETENINYTGNLVIYIRPDDFSRVLDSSRLISFHVKLEDYKELCDEIISEIDKFREEVDKLIKEKDNIDVDVLKGELEIVFDKFKKIQEKDKLIKQHLDMIETNSDSLTVLAECNLIRELL